MSLPKIIAAGRRPLIDNTELLMFAEVEVVVAAAVVREKLLATNLLHQKQDEWCWASVAVCVAEAYADGPAEQCKIASKVVGRTCCPDGTDSNCNVQKLLSKALSVKNNYVGFDGNRANFTFDFVTDSIDQHKPIPVHIKFPGASHYAVIVGYREDSGVRNVYVRDPANADGVRSAVIFDQFLNAYKFTGVWDRSYETNGTQTPAVV
jgi:hypothetical protein